LDEEVARRLYDQLNAPQGKARSGLRARRAVLRRCTRAAPRRDATRGARAHARGDCTPALARWRAFRPAWRSGVCAHTATAL
jgi:hypothetical protein